MTIRSREEYVNKYGEIKEAFDTAKPVSTPELEFILKRLRDSNETFSFYTNRVRAINDKVFGCIPEVASENKNKTEHNGLINAIQFELDETDRLRTWLAHEISRLESLA